MLLLLSKCISLLVLINLLSHGFYSTTALNLVPKRISYLRFCQPEPDFDKFGHALSAFYGANPSVTFISLMIRTFIKHQN